MKKKETPAKPKEEIVPQTREMQPKLCTSAN
jgi:hypothetical protein